MVNDENVSSKPENPTTSKIDSFVISVDPLQQAHNVDELKHLNVNSADDVRQAIRCLAASSYQRPCTSDACNQGSKHGDFIAQVPSAIPKKSPGRLPKAGLSKRRRRAPDMYLGKLSNVVSFKRTRTSFLRKPRRAYKASAFNTILIYK